LGRERGSNLRSRKNRAKKEKKQIDLKEKSNNIGVGNKIDPRQKGA
jgi:hypothetical protein